VNLLASCLCKKWNLEQKFNPNTPPFVDWVKGVIHGQQLDLGNLDVLDVVLLCNKPSQVAM